MIEIPRKLGIEWNFLDMVKGIYAKAIINIILNGERLKTFLLRLGTRQGCLLSPLLFRIILEVLTRALRQGREIKGIQIGQEEIKLSLLANDIILNIENPPKCTHTHRELLELINKFCKVAEYKMNIQKPVVFL